MSAAPVEAPASPTPASLPAEADETPEKRRWWQPKPRGRRRGKPQQSSKPSAKAAASRPSSEREYGQIRKRSWALESLNYYELAEEPELTSTVQAAGLHLAIAGAPSPAQGLLVGFDAMTSWPVYYDQFEAYDQGRIGSPAVTIVGAINSGKSSLAKTLFVIRQLTLGRRVVVTDKKSQGVNTSDGQMAQQGEYTLLAQLLGIRPVVFDRNAPEETRVRINVLDPTIAVRGDDEGADGEVVSQGDLLRVMAHEALGRELEPTERKALRIAHMAAIDTARRLSRVATITDVIGALLEPNYDPADPEVRGARSADELHAWGLNVGLALEDLVKHELSGLIDGETSNHVDLNNALTVFDISRLPDHGPAIAIVMALIDTWMRATVARQDVIIPTVSVTEEGWYLVKGSMAATTQRNIKQARGTAFSAVTALQHISDVAHDPQAVSVIKEADTVFIYRQGREDDAAECVRLFNLPPAAKELIMELDQGTCLMLVGQEPPVLLHHLRSEIEVGIANTDDAMTSRGTLVLTDRGISDRHRGLMEQVSAEYKGDDGAQPVTAPSVGPQD